MQPLRQHTAFWEENSDCSAWTPWQTATVSSKNEMKKQQHITTRILIQNRKEEKKDFKKCTEMLCYFIAKNLNSSACGKLLILV